MDAVLTFAKAMNEFQKAAGNEMESQMKLLQLLQAFKRVEHVNVDQLLSQTQVPQAPDQQTDLGGLFNQLQ